jgi:two-component SAPR family response regulator
MKLILYQEITGINFEEKINQINGKPIKLYFVDAYEK